MYYIENTEKNGKLVNTFNKGTITPGSKIRQKFKKFNYVHSPFQGKIPR